MTLTFRLFLCGFLLGLAFHPHYGDNGSFFVNYTASPPRRTVIARFSVDKKDPESADPRSEQKLLEFPQPYENHNGGEVLFGNDGYLHIGTGDGGSAGDPHNNGQSLTTLLGKILRIDVDHPALSGSMRTKSFIFASLTGRFTDSR